MIERRAGDVLSAVELSPPEAAYLAARGSRAIGATLVGLAHMGLIEFREDGKVVLVTGATQGIVLYGDRNMPITDFSLTGGGTQNFGGAIYLPKAHLKFSGGNGTSTSCTKLIADTITFTGTSNVQVDCAALGTASIGPTTAQLVE